MLHKYKYCLINLNPDNVYVKTTDCKTIVIMYDYERAYKVDDQISKSDIKEFSAPEMLGEVE